MKVLFSLMLLVSCYFVHAQKKYVGPPNNVGREYGNPKMPLMVSHLAGANKERLKRVNKNSRHSFFGKILCFRKLCRIQSGHTASLNAISFKKYKRKIARHAKKHPPTKQPIDSTYKQKPVVPKQTTPVPLDTITTAAPIPVATADTLIVLGAELLFETNKSTLRSEHFATLNPIVGYLLSHPTRTVTISGHTDTTGSEQHNRTLSKNRADVVAEYLVGNGVNIDRVETFGYGSQQPIAPNTTEDGRMKNRRVELLIRDKQ